MAADKTSRKLSAGILLIVALVGCLCITTFAALFVSVTVGGNTFETGGVGINLNDGEPVIEAGEFLFEPGMTVEKDFFVENTGSDSIYYKLYFKEVSGELADALEISIMDGEKILLSGKANELTEEASVAVDDILAVGEKRDLKMIFHFPEDSENDFQSKDLSFVFYAKSVQTKNNTEKIFD